MNTMRVALMAACISAAFGTFGAPASDPAQDIRDAWSQSAAKSLPRLENEARLRQVFRSMAREMEMLRSTEDEGERERLTRMHASHLHEATMLIRVIGGHSMRLLIADHTRPRRETAAEPALAEASSGPGVDPEQRLKEMENRLDMLQMVIESMLEHLTMPGTRT